MATTNTIVGDPQMARGKFALVVSRFNESITSRLLAGALDAFADHHVPQASITVVWVPGAFEIPLAADRLAASGEFEAVVCLGAVVRGETSHDRHINHAVSQALMQIGIHREVPVLFGVLTCDSLEQAFQRSGGTHGNKGADCAIAALEMADLLLRLPG